VPENFQTVSEEEFCEVRLSSVRRDSPFEPS
jgi:hypothetical protein